MAGSVFVDGIGGGTPNSSAVSQVDSTTQGVLIPRMTTTQRDAIITPATSLLIYNTTTSAFNVYNGSAWVSLTTLGGSMTSAQLAAIISDETGTGALVFANTPTLVTPVLGVASATSVSLGDGAVGTPSLLFTSDTDTGLYRVGANKLSIVAGGTAIMTLSLFSTVRVFEVGDGSGSSQMNFYGATGTDRAVFFYTGSSTSRWKLYVNGTTESGSDVGSDFVLDSRNDAGSALVSNVIFAKRSNGNVGLQTASPTNILSLSGQAARTIWMERHTTSNTAGNSLTVQSGGATSAATNKAAGALILATGVGTGNAVPALARVQGGAASDTSGTGDQTQVDRFIANGFKVLTNNSAITILNATLAASTMIGGVIDYTVEVWNGTDYQVETGRVYYSGGNKAGAFGVTATKVNNQQNTSSGTLTTTWAISSANPAAISINANSSLTPSTGYPRITYSVHNFAQQALAVA